MASSIYKARHLWCVYWKECGEGAMRHSEQTIDFSVYLIISRPSKYKVLLCLGLLFVVELT